MQASKQIQKYFKRLEEDVKQSYEIASAARQKGYDPEKRVDIPVAKGVAQRVEGLISAVAPQIMKSGVAERIIQLEKERIAEEKMHKLFCKAKHNKSRRMI